MVNLFYHEPVSSFIDQRMSEVRARVEQLTDAQLEGPDLGETLKVLSKFDFKLATLEPDQRKGKRRTEKRQINDYGRNITVDVDLIDVTIPFDGWPKSFHLAPSSHTIIDIPVTITRESALQISLPDDPNLDRSVDIFIQRVAGNLVSLGNDLRKLEGQLLQEAQRGANRRIQQIRERRERDKTRSFPIE